MEQNEFSSSFQHSSEDQPQSVFDLSITPSVAYSLRQISKWASIFAYIGGSLLLLAVLICAIAWTAMENVLANTYGGVLYGAFGAGLAIGIFIAVAIYGTLLALLIIFGMKVKQGLLERNLEKIESGVTSLKSYFLISGILSAIFLLFVVLGLITIR